MADLSNVEVLEGSAPTTGGIVVRKKKSSNKADDEAPKVSLLGLDKLAGKVVQLLFTIRIASFYILFTEQKRKLKEALLQELKDESDEEKQGDEAFQKPHSKVERKALRMSKETPTYTGGVSDEAKRRLEERHKRDKERRFHNSSKVS